MTEHKRFFSKIGFNYIILFILSTIFQIILFNALNITFPQYLNDINVIYVLSALCNYILPFPIFYWLMKKLETTKIEKQSIGIKTFIIYIGITLTLMWIGNIVGLIITYLLSGLVQNAISNPVQELINTTDIWFNILIVSILAPIFEEILFRKLLIDRSIKYGAKISIILSATLFGLFHANLNQFFYAFLMGGFFAYIYIKTGKITYTIVLHAIVNIMGSVVSLILAESYMNLLNNFNMFDLTIIIAYLLIIVISLVIGIIGLSRYKKARFNGEKTQIELEYPYNTTFVNYGMLFFIGIFIVQMIYQIL